MDYIKNTQKSEHLPKFLDSVQAVKTNPFGDNRSADRVYRRTERLVAAIHLLTNHIPPEEPLRARVRSSSLALLSDAMDLRDEMRALESYRLHSFQAGIRHLISMLRILAIAGFVSIQNADAVTEALDELGNFLAVSQRSPLSENIRLTRDDLIDVHVADVSLKKDIKDSIYLKDKETKKTVLYEEKTAITNRGSIIMDILRSGGEFGIRDIVAQIPEYSEKMVQRELLDLVNKGAIKKSGLKRWSRYSLPENVSKNGAGGPLH